MLDYIFKGKNIVNFFTSIYAIILTVLSIIMSPIGKVEANEKPEAFVPIMRFAVTSDVHIKDDGNYAERERLAEMIKTSYKIAEANPYYKSLDAVCFSGDITDKGTDSSFEMFRAICDSQLKGNTLLLPVLGNHDYGTHKENSRDVFAKYFDYGPDFDVNINGVHIIGSSKSGSNEVRSLSSASWLNSALKNAKAENEHNPIFVLRHEHIFSSVYGSINWGDPSVWPILARYPQVIDFSGHSHYPINDPRSIWQGAFTALGTGTLSYFELEADGVAGYAPENYREAAQFYIVEVDKDGAVMIQPYDLISDSFFGETYYLPTPWDRSSFEYNTLNRRSQSSSPVFSAGTTASVAMLENGETALVFPNAESTDGMIINNYRITVRDEKGNYVYEGVHFSGYYFKPEPLIQNAPVGVLESGKKYSAAIKAENAYGKKSEAFTFEFVAP